MAAPTPRSTDAVRPRPAPRPRRSPRPIATTTRTTITRRVVQPRSATTDRFSPAPSAMIAIRRPYLTITCAPGAARSPNPRFPTTAPATSAPTTSGRSGAERTARCAAIAMPSAINRPGHIAAVPDHARTATLAPDSVVGFPRTGEPLSALVEADFEARGPRTHVGDGA